MADSKRYVIVGNGVAGTTAAETIKKLEPQSQVTLLAAEPYPLYNRVSLPHYLKGTVSEDKVFMRSVEQHAEKGIDLRLETRVVSVHPDERVVVTEAGETFPYDRLLIATGGRPRPLPAPGAETPGVYYFQTLDDTRQIVERFATARRAVVVGGSFIAYELAEGFRRRGLEVVWLIRGPRWLRRILDEDGGRLVDLLARDHGIEILYGEEVAQVHAAGGTVKAVTTTGGQTIEADMVGCGLGLDFYTELLEGSGVEVQGGVVTNERLETSVPGIYAAGDVARFFDVFIGRHNQMGTWNNAMTHGRVVGANMVGANRPYREVPVYSSGLFDSKITAIGATPENHPEVEAVSHVDWENRQYQRLFFLDGRLVGAVLIGDLRARKKIVDMITQRETVDDPNRLILSLT
ncbi:NAD(P)/FAD-dependent oxidoreductase [Thermaerobacter sp. PB12/4term]|uniref:NAD(P)/FAD-dependent oxidoreductase n=1 Tax=Thermaerobacter sp. PB12/4term TaxID=2293838 RepID=UPI000E325E97|nr:FAD-dependent oxidoreductase [Thermaerobacter sp. PB12/4term]QIA27343.1 NAD(P)/FAD-dependent oxidoreductase [Thermaerobacter sp. PB12/4term]